MALRRGICKFSDRVQGWCLIFGKKRAHMGLFTVIIIIQSPALSCVNIHTFANPISMRLFLTRTREL